MKFVLAAAFQATRRKQNRRAQRMMGSLTYTVILLVPLIFVALLVRAWPILVSRPILELLFSTTWKPLQNVFGSELLDVGNNRNSVRILQLFYRLQVYPKNEAMFTNYG